MNNRSKTNHEKMDLGLPQGGPEGLPDGNLAPRRLWDPKESIEGPVESLQIIVDSPRKHEQKATNNSQKMDLEGPWEVPKGSRTAIWLQDASGTVLESVPGSSGTVCVRF